MTLGGRVPNVTVPASQNREGETAIADDKSKERVLRGRIGAYVLHSRYDSGELTKAARAAFESKFEREVDPEGVLPPEERLRRAEMARRAHYARLALKSAQARGKRSNRRKPPPGSDVPASSRIDNEGVTS